MFKAFKDWFTWGSFIKAVEQARHIDPKKDITKYLAALKLANLAAEKLLAGEKREHAKQILAALALVGTAKRTAFNSDD